MFNRIYEKLEEFIPVGFFLLIFVLMMSQVFTRYIFNFTLPWNLELCRYSLVWLTFLGCAYVRKNDSHIKIEILFNFINNKLFPRGKKIFWVFKQILTFAFLISLIYLGFILAIKSVRFKSQAMQISQFYLYISVSLGAFLYCIRELQESFHYWQKFFFKT